MPPVKDTPTVQVSVAVVTQPDCRGVIDRDACVPGNHSECPPPANAPDHTVCLDNGKCLDGECVPFCQAFLMLQPCACNGSIHTHTHTRAGLGSNKVPVSVCRNLHLM